MRLSPWSFAKADTTKKMAINYRGADISSELAILQSNWEELSPNYPFDYEFLDQNLGSAL